MSLNITHENVSDTIISYLLNSLEYIVLTQSCEERYDIRLAHKDWHRFSKNRKSGIIDTGAREFHRALYVVDKTHAATLIDDPSNIPDAFWIGEVIIEHEEDHGTYTSFVFNVDSIGLLWGKFAYGQNTLASRIQEKIVDQAEEKFMILDRNGGPFYVEMTNIIGNVVNDKIHAGYGSALSCRELQCLWTVPVDEGRRYSTVRPYRLNIGDIRLRVGEGQFRELSSHGAIVYMGLPEKAPQAFNQMSSNTYNLLAKDKIFPSVIDQMIFLSHLEGTSND